MLMAIVSECFAKARLKRSCVAIRHLPRRNYFVGGTGRLKPLAAPTPRLMYQNRQICLSCTALYETHPHTALFTCSANLSLNYEVKLSDWYNKFAKKNEKDPKTRHQTRDSGWWPRKSTANFLVKSVLYYVHDNRKDLAFAKIVESDFPIRHLNVQRENFSDIQTVFQDAVDRIEGERGFGFEWNYNKRGTRWTL